MSRPFIPQLDANLVPTSTKPGQRSDTSLLEFWLSEVSDVSYNTSASPLVATTITPETIQNLLHAYGFPIEAARTDSVPGPFEDSQFDLVVDVQTTDEESDFYMDESENFKSSDIDDAICSSDGISEDEFSILTDFVLSPRSSSLSDNDFNGSDSGIEAEMEELLDGADDTNKTNQGNQKSGDGAQTCDAKQSGQSNSTSSSSHTAPPAVTSNSDHRSQMKKERHETKAEHCPAEDELDFQCQFLWEFLHHLLASKKYSNIITWKNQSRGIFRLLDHNSVARLWGVQKKRKNMTYDKLSRALRYYYSKNILKKVDGQRLTYKFVKNLSGKKYP